MKAMRNLCRGALVLPVSALLSGPVLAAASPAAGAPAAVARQASAVAWQVQGPRPGVPAAPFWGRIVPKPGSNSFLTGVFCVSASDCWAVGYYSKNVSGGTDNVALNQALHWNGHAWSLVSTPEPDGTGAGASNQLHDVSCTSASNCWAAGNYGSIDDNGAGSVLSQALHWDGGVWSLADTPDPAGTSGSLNDLEGIRCTSAGNCWAVGNRAKIGGADVNQALHWNGRKWASG